MKTEAELLELYAEAYKYRSVEGIKDYISDSLIYTIPGQHPQVMSKNQFLKYLQNKFYGQKELVTLKSTKILLVYNTTTEKENVYICWKCRGEYLFSIVVKNSYFFEIKISKYNNEELVLTKSILEKQNYDSNEEGLLKFNYLESGVLMILKEDDPSEVINTIINTNYQHESCIGEGFDPLYLINLIKNGFYIMSTNVGNNRILLEAIHHLSRSVLFFDHLHIKKSVKKLLSKYELRVNVDFNLIIEKCIENHNDHWLSKPFVEAIKKLYVMNNKDVEFICFGLYKDEKLVAGDFGTKVGRIYSSYSGFHEENNSGTVQMILTAKYLENNGYAFWDLGMPIAYKSTIGAKVINLKDFIDKWRKYSIQEISLNLGYEKFPLSN